MINIPYQPHKPYKPNIHFSNLVNPQPEKSEVQTLPVAIRIGFDKIIRTPHVKSRNAKVKFYAHCTFIIIPLLQSVRQHDGQICRVFCHAPDHTCSMASLRI